MCVVELLDLVMYLYMLLCVIMYFFGFFVVLDVNIRSVVLLGEIILVLGKWLGLVNRVLNLVDVL